MLLVFVHYAIVAFLTSCLAISATSESKGYGMLAYIYVGALWPITFPLILCALVIEALYLRGKL